MAFLESIPVEVINTLELASFPGNIQIIDRVGPEFTKAINYLKRQSILGFDTETRPCFTAKQPRNSMALLQLSGPEKAYLFRVRDMGVPPKLAAILSNANILKIGAAVHDDIKGLQKYNKFFANGFVDLQKIVWEWGIRDKSVKKMTAIILGYKISKLQQLSNWEAEQLSHSQQLYAATDAWVCREMYKKLQISPKNPLDLTVNTISKNDKDNIKEK